MFHRFQHHRKNFEGVHHVAASCLSVLICLLVATACSPGVSDKTRGMSLLPSGRGVEKLSDKGHRGLISNGGIYHSFSDVVGVLLSDTDLDQFVDPDIQGADRRLAVHLLKLMPANKRGDFTYVRNNSILSNRTDLARGVVFLKAGDPRLPAAAPSPRLPGSSRRPLDYPPSGGSGGPYIRHYSAQGVNAALGYATPPCNSNIGYGDNGDMYFNSYTGTSAGSIVDAGVYVDGGLRAHPFINEGSYGGYNYTGWTNYYNSWPCGAHLGMMYGTIYGTGMSVLVLGLPDYDPTTYELPPASTQWHQATWNFFQTPSILTVGPGQWHYISSPCMGCSVARMFTITPANSYADRSCFGWCGASGLPTGRWDQVVMGELIQPCQQVKGQSEQCTIEYTTDGSAYGGANHGGGGSAAPWGLDYDTNSQVNGVEGIALGVTGGAQTFRTPDGTFQPLQPYPPDTPNGACEQAASNAGFGQVPIDSLSNQPQPEYVAAQGYSSGQWVLAESQTASNTDSGSTYTYGPPICYI